MDLTHNLPIAGVVTHEHDARQFLLTNHLDLPSLLPFAERGGLTNLGTRDIYALSKKEDVPFMLPNIQGGTIENINGNEYTFDVATSSELTTTLVSIDVPAGSKLGEHAQPFKITLSNGRLGGFGARLTPSPMLPYALEVINFERKGVEEHVQYEVVFRGNHKGETFIPNDMLPLGQPLFKLGATRSREFGQNYDSWAIGGGVNKKFISRLTTAELQTHYHMTYEACAFADGRRMDAAWVKENLYKVVDFIGIKAQTEGQILNPKISTYEQYLASPESNKTGSIIGFKFLATIYDQISMGILKKEIINTMVWDAGGITGSDGHDKQYIHTGTWHQMDYSGTKHTFSIPTISKELILAAIRSHEVGKKDAPTYGKERVYKIKTGRAGVMLLNKLFEKEFLAATTGMVMANAIGQYEGTYQTGLKVYTPWYRSITIAGQYTLVWELDPSLDPDRMDTFINPLVNGYRLSSYAMIIEDADYSASNIKILRNEFLGANGGMRMFVVNGTRSHPFYEATNNGIPIHPSAGLSSGFGAYFHATPDTAIVWDPTKMLKLSPINPYTGKALF